LVREMSTAGAMEELKITQQGEVESLEPRSPLSVKWKWLQLGESAGGGEGHPEVALEPVILIKYHLRIAPSELKVLCRRMYPVM
jgi:hypothetical protein